MGHKSQIEHESMELDKNSCAGSFYIFQIVALQESQVYVWDGGVEN